MGVIDLRNPKPPKRNSSRPTLNGIEARRQPKRPVKPEPVETELELAEPSPLAEPEPQVKAVANSDRDLGAFRKWASLLILSLALAIIIIDTTLLNVSLRSIIADLHTDIKGLQWVITAYALVLAALTITGGRLGDLFGRKKMFISGAIIFAAGSLLASVSHRLGVLVAGESIIEGIGAALMMPATASLLISTFKGRERAIAFGVWGSVAGAASAIGPILGGYLTTHYSWRWGFRINVFVAAVLVLGSVLIRESRDTAEKAQLDILGIILSASGLLAAVFGIIQSSTYGWIKAKESYAIFGHALSSTISITAYSLVAGIVLLLAFVGWEYIRERRGKTPLVSLQLFKNKQFTTGAMTMALMSLSMVGLIFVLPVFLQAVKGLDAYHTGLTLLPMSLALLVVGPLAGFISHWIPPKRLIQMGLLVCVVAVVVLHASLTVDATSASLAPALLLYGIGMGLVMAQISNLTLSAVPVQQAGEASGVNNTFRQVGSSMGSAILGAVLLTAITTNVTNNITSSSIIPRELRTPLATSVGAHASSAAFGEASGAGSHLPIAAQVGIEQAVKQGTTDATRTTALYGIPFTILALLMSTQLAGKRDTIIEPPTNLAGGH